MSDEKTADDYALRAADPDTVDAPELPYQPPAPKTYRPKIGLIACGGITQSHLDAYRTAGFDVAVLCDLVREKAEKRRAEFFPDADVTTDYREVLARDDIEVVDIATHPPDRLPLIEAALNARKHVLSQKPFVLDLDEGARLADLADAQGVRFAVNQNGRWAPHFAYIREAVQAGRIGDLMSVHVGVHWDHTWVKGTPFERIRDLVLYDFAIHWFDFVSTLLGDRERETVFATRGPAIGQTIGPPMLAQAIVAFDGGQASLVFDAHAKFGSIDRTYVAGTEGTLISDGPDLSQQSVRLHTAAGVARPRLTGQWFNDGFRGTMGELLLAIEENRAPRNAARDNLKSLELCFAAIASADDGLPKVPGQVRRLPEGAIPKTLVTL